MHGGVVELHALTDADRARAQHHGLFALGDDGLVRTLVAGVEVRDVRAGVAGVHHAVEGHHAVCAALVPDFRLVHVPQPGDELVGEAQLLGPAQHIEVADVGLQHRLVVGDALHGLQEVGGDGGDFVDLIYTDAPAQQLRDGVEAVVPEHGDVLLQRLGGHGVELRHVQVAHADLQRAHRLQQALLKA